MFKRHARSALILLLVITLVIPFFTTGVSAAYENTYYNTGNMRDDIIGVALTQVGYSEGYNGYTKYGDWYGYPYLDWCGMFVSWCAKEADIPSSILNRTGLADPDCFGLSYMDGSYYTPIKGDLFFKKDFSHVGLVYYTDGNYFYTIEGNTSDVGWEGTSVLIQCRRISDCYFSSPDYSGSYSDDVYYGCDHNYITMYDTSHPHDEYKTCTDCDDYYYTGDEGFSDDCTECIQSVCDHAFGSWLENDDGYHTRICSYCEYEENESHDWIVDKVLQDATCVEDGSRLIICSVCNAESTEIIDATNEHAYSKFSYINESEHQKICNGCSEKSVSQHVLNSDWKYNNIYHWTSCVDCNGRIRHNEHNFLNGCTAPCVDCGYVNTNGHKTTGEKFSDSNKHWEICSKCGQQINDSLHVYSSECDENCNTCGFQRKTTKNHSIVIKANESGHWETCTACSYTTNAISHTPDENAHEWDVLTCTHCKYVLRSSAGHIHSFATVKSDAHTHWGTCECGEELQPEVHMWDFQTNSCSICGTKYAANNYNSGNMFVEFFKNLFKIK